MDAIGVEVLTTSSKIVQHGKLRKARERQGKSEDNLQKELLTRLIFAKLTQYKLLGLNKELIDIYIHDFCIDFQKLKIDLESSKAQNEKLKFELNST